jgi:DNA mismatch endonuclease (patch repair protein)
MDMYTKKRRSEIMSRITSRDTRPELRVRSVLHRMGYRFRLHKEELPGKPDIVLPKWRVVVLVHGCFWHGHDCCEGHVPKSNAAYWAPKLERNRRRDAENAEKLRQLGWTRIVIWECQTYSLRKIEQRLREAMKSAGLGAKPGKRQLGCANNRRPMHNAI